MRDARTYMDCIFEEKMEIDLKMVDREAGQFLVLAGLVRSAGLTSRVCQCAKSLKFHS